MLHFRILAFIICFVTISLWLISTVQTIIENNLSINDICFSSACVIEFSEKFTGSIEIIKAGAYILWIFAAVSGVYIALSNYINTLKSTALTGYINHLRLFRDYLQEQSENLKRINIGRIDTHIWYELAFPNAKQGDVNVSPMYLAAVQSVVKVFEDSSNKLTPGGGKFAYVEHQNRLANALKAFGIHITTMPKNDFTAMENDLILLLDSVNRTFADNVVELYKCERLYL